MALKPGDSLLNDQYRILRQLGHGGFGFVYLAQDTLLSEDVAIKELIPALVGNDAMLKRFLAEAKATMRLTHSQIVRTHNVFQQGDNYYIVMEFMPGGSLEDHLRQQAPMPVDDAVRITAQVCAGLQCAHDQGVVHCDLKPANILLSAQNSAKVADFGIAHVSEEMLSRTWMTPAGFVAGTLPYMSPEQAEGVRDDPRVDVYATGAVLYRMLTGRTYLDFDQRETPATQADNVYRIRRQQPGPPQRLQSPGPGLAGRRCAQGAGQESGGTLRRRGATAGGVAAAGGGCPVVGADGDQNGARGGWSPARARSHAVVAAAGLVLAGGWRGRGAAGVRAGRRATRWGWRLWGGHADGGAGGPGADADRSHRADLDAAADGDGQRYTYDDAGADCDTTANGDSDVGTDGYTVADCNGDPDAYEYGGSDCSTDGEAET